MNKKTDTQPKTMESKAIESFIRMKKTKKHYLITEQDDGNYKGFTVKNEKLCEVRQGDPGTVLTLLITHDGKTD